MLLLGCCYAAMLMRYIVIDMLLYFYVVMLTCLYCCCYVVILLCCYVYLIPGATILELHSIHLYPVISCDSSICVASFPMSLRLPCEIPRKHHPLGPLGPEADADA